MFLCWSFSKVDDDSPAIDTYVAEKNISTASNFLSDCRLSSCVCLYFKIYL